MDWKCQICNQDWRVLLNASRRLWQLLNFTLETLRVFLRQLIVSWNNESEVPDFMNGNRKFDVSLDGTLLSHTMNLNAFVLTPAVRICWVRSVRGRKWQPEVDFFSLCLGRQFSHCVRSQMSLPCPLYQQSNYWSMQNRFLSCLLKK